MVRYLPNQETAKKYSLSIEYALKNTPGFRPLPLEEFISTESISLACFYSEEEVFDWIADDDKCFGLLLQNGMCLVHPDGLIEKIRDKFMRTIKLDMEAVKKHITPARITVSSL